jgi:hypothetical protein
MDLVPVDFETGRSQLAAEREFPASRSVERFIDDAAKVGRNFKLTTLERTHPIATEPADEVTEYQHHILTGARLRGSPLRTSFIIRGQQHNGETNIAMSFDLLNHRAAFVSPLMKDDWLESERLDKARDCFACSVVVAVHHEDF